MRVWLAVVTGMLAAGGMAAPQKRPAMQKPKVAITKPALPRVVSATGVLGREDLIAIARLGAVNSTDQFSENTTASFIGREYSLVLANDNIDAMYDRNTKTLNLVLSRYADSVRLDDELVDSTYSGQNGFGAKAQIAKTRGKSFGIWLPGSIYERKPLSLTVATSGELARSLSQNVQARISGKIIEAKGAYAESGSAIMRKSLIIEPTVTAPNDVLITQYNVAVSVETIDWVDTRTGQPIKP